MAAPKLLVSIVCVCRNADSTVRRCIDSLLVQDYPNMEIVVQDGASTDGTMQILREYGDRIKLVSERDSCAEEGFFRALKRCNGDIVVSSYADEELLSGAVSWAVKGFAEYPDAGAIYGDHYSTDIDGCIFNENVVSEAFDIRRYVCHEIVPPACSLFFRRECIEAAKPSSGEWTIGCGEFELIARLGMRYPIYHLAGTVSKFAVHSGSHTSQASDYRRIMPVRLRVLEELLSDPATPADIRKLRQRARSGIRLWFAEAFWKVGEPDEARSMIREALAYDPNFERFAEVIFGLYGGSGQQRVGGAHFFSAFSRFFLKCLFGGKQSIRRAVDLLRTYLFVGSHHDAAIRWIRALAVLANSPLRCWRDFRGVLSQQDNRSLAANPGAQNLLGDRDVEWAWIAGHIPVGPGKCLDFGPGDSNLGLVAAMQGFDVVALDLNRGRTPYHQPDTKYVYDDILKHTFSEEMFDLVLNCSAIEHVGLAGSYRNSDEVDGDLEAMSRIRNWIKPTGLHLLTIPIGHDAVFLPLHRVYGQKRLSLLLAGWTVQAEQFWLKAQDGLWHMAERDDALAATPRADFYGLGLFVLTPAASGE